MDYSFKIVGGLAIVLIIIFVLVVLDLRKEGLLKVSAGKYSFGGHK